ncbi:LOW QUALITY PROTEIN: bridge-like lipid transfer protein family member 3B [Uloborus diversus]|uniref:LOW QUALITY PROTEIN: bridge-like lipid transfer protein family member 3B n=1 Tax=Uloborus diversus TaxID=327109 RepID=UPI002409FC4D|nr:LOW QUALITY PROTEIN: bridge-like lipid transfer protein family member 3B [Uloborus diversus]
MASIFKNQLLKHLSKFAKNLSPDKLHLSTLKGHGELRNLELNEKVLTELLELPAWLNLKCATCNHVTLQISWTKLKSVPIYLSLDEVIVEIETCEDLRPPTPMSSEASYKSGGKYGFSDRVIDGMTVVVNSVVINFNSPAFQASFQLSRVVLESYCPFFKKKDLRLSRIKDADRGEVLLFKRLEWQVLRIEAKSRDNDANGLRGDIPLTPLRLITNQGCCKMTIKKKLCDCSVVGSRLIFVLDDLLWVLTDAQLVAALHFIQSLSGLVQKATELTQKQKAKQKLEQQPDRHVPGTHSKSNLPLSPAFYRHDVVETSYHVLCSRIDLHLCDDMDPKDGRSQHPNLRGGGALQVSLDKLIVDYYPFHRAFASRDHWLHYSEPSSSRSTWVQQLLTLFNEKLQTKTDSLATENESPKHNLQKSSPSSTENINTGSPVTPDDKPLLTRKASTVSNSSGTLTPDTSRRSIGSFSRKSSLQWNYRYLMSSCFVLRLEDIVAYKVSTSTSSRTHSIEKFLIYNKSAHMPSDIKTIHLEQASYYLPGEIDFPVPSPNLFLHLGPLKLYLDTPTILWINAFYLNLQKCLMSLKMGSAETQSLVNIRAEALLPQIVIPTDLNSPTQPDRPRTLQLQSSRAIATNCRLGDHTTRNDLSECLEFLNADEMFSNATKFPWKNDKKPIPEAFFNHVLGKECENQSQKDVLTESTDIWSIYFDPFWAEFTVCESGRTRLQSFVDPLPLTLWFYSSQKPQEVLRKSINKTSAGKFKMQMPNKQLECQKDSYINVETFSNSTYTNNNNLNNNDRDDEADVYLLIHINSLLNVQLSHFQYLFVLRAADIITDMMEHLEIDTATIIKNKPVLSVCTSILFPQIELSLVLRNLNQMSATSESADLASLQDCSSASDIPQNYGRKILQSKSSFSVGECDITTKKAHPDTLCSGILDDCCMENGIPKSCSDSLLNCHSSGSSQGLNTPIQESQPSTATDSFQKGFQTGTSAMKRGLCSLVASIDSALTKSDQFNSMDADSPSFPDDDAISLRSDVSSDLDQFVLVNQDGSLEDEFFQHARPEIGFDVASKMKEDSIISNYTLNSEKKKEMVSITMFEFGKVAFVYHSKLASSVLIHCSQIETKEETAISWENFQNKFSLRGRSWKNEEKRSFGECEFSLRLDKDNSFPSDGTKNELGPGFLSILASNLYLQFQMNSISGLVEFFEDEMVSKPMPSKIILDNLQLQLQEERPPSGLPSPSSAPLNISLPGCIIERTLDGTLSVLPLPHGYVLKNLGDLLNHCSFNENVQKKVDTHKYDCGSEDVADTSICDNSSDEQLSITKLMRDNKELRSKLNLMKNLEQENQILRQELNLLRNTVVDDEKLKQLLDSKNEIRRLEHEKNTLQETLRLLQKEVSRLEMEKHCPRKNL